MRVGWIVGASLSILLAITILGLKGVREKTGGSPPRPPEAQGAPSLLLITIDTWRWDYIGASGAGKVKTPNLDRLAREGIYEPEAVTPYPLTTPAHASLLTGLHPVRHGVLNCTNFSLPPSIPTLAESFKTKGYRTAAFIAGEPLKARYGLNRGFDHYDDSGLNSVDEQNPGFGSRDGAQIVDAVLTHLHQIPSSAPSFLWVHFFDPHLPYRDHPEYTRKYPGQPYAAEVAYVDFQIGRLLGGLPRQGKGWKILVVGDHGEGLGDHGEGEHGLGLYASTINVPFIISPAPEKPLAHLRPWGLIDIAPTLAEWFGLPLEKTVDGESLFQKGVERRVLTTFTILPSMVFGVQPVVGGRLGRLNYLKHRDEELFDLSSDPQEAHDLGSDPAFAQTLKALRGETLRMASTERIQQAMGRTPWTAPTPEEIRSLTSLGYVGGRRSIGVSGLPQGDLSKLLRDNEYLAKVREQGSRTGDRRSLRECIGKLSRDYPSSTSFLKQEASFLIEDRDYRRAAEVCRQAVRLDPKDSESMTNWGTACLMMGQIQEARVVLENALEINEKDPIAHKSLSIIYGRSLNRPEQALRHAERYVQLEPGAPDRKAMESWADSLRAGTAARK